MAALREHHDQGYRFALDDFTFDEQTRPFLPYCDFVKHEGPLGGVLQSVIAYEQAQQITDHLA